MARKGSETYYDGVVGYQITDGRPEGELAVLEVEHQASPERVERARMFFKEADLSDFEPRGTLGRRWLHRETQREYLLDESQVLDAGDPTTSGVEFFAVHGGKLMFLRPRDWDPVRSRVYHGTLVAGQLARGPGGRDVLVPPREPRTDGRPWVPPQ